MILKILKKNNKMDPGMTSVSISLLLLGFTAGLSVDMLYTRKYIEKVQGAFQKGITTAFEKDKEIDELKKELETVRKQYKELHAAMEELKRTLNRVSHFPSPPTTPLRRTETYFDSADFSYIEPSSPFVLDSTD
jgi:hypothetical protein